MKDKKQQVPFHKKKNFKKKARNQNKQQKDSSFETSKKKGNFKKKFLDKPKTWNKLKKSPRLKTDTNRKSPTQETLEVKKSRKKIKIKENALEKAEEIIQESRKNLLNNLQEVQSPFFSGLDSQDAQKLSPMRINRYLARCGLGARRTVEAYILEGKVAVNGIIVTDLSKKIHPEKDEVTFEGQVVKLLEKDLILAFNKPAGFLCSHQDIHHEKTVFNLLPIQYRRLNMAGRLDLNSRGLMIFTTDGNFIQTLSHPTGGIEKTYLLKVENLPSEKELVENFLHGIEYSGELLRAKSVRVLNRDEGKVEVVLKEGKKRQLHRMFQALNSKVLDLQRVKIGNLSLEDLGLQEGEYKLISKKEILGE